MEGWVRKMNSALGAMAVMAGVKHLKAWLPAMQEGEWGRSRGIASRAFYVRGCCQSPAAARGHARSGKLGSSMISCGEFLCCSANDRIHAWRLRSTISLSTRFSHRLASSFLPTRR